MTEITEQLKVAIADRYVVERELGAGGMATVFLAHDVRHLTPADGLLTDGQYINTAICCIKMYDAIHCDV